MAGLPQPGPDHRYYPPYIWEDQDQLPLPANEDGAKGESVHDRFTRFGLDFIEAHKDEPFFLYMAYTVSPSRRIRDPGHGSLCGYAFGRCRKRCIPP